MHDEPSLRDRNWRAFSLEKEENSALAEKHWSSYREGLRRLEKKFLGLVPAKAARRALAEDAFFCATHWRHEPRVVRPALRELLNQSLDTKLLAFAAAEYWLWASKVAPVDLPEAEKMVERARKEIETKALDEMSRENLRRMMAVVVDGNRSSSGESPQRPAKRSRSPRRRS